MPSISSFTPAGHCETHHTQLGVRHLHRELRSLHYHRMVRTQSTLGKYRNPLIGVILTGFCSKFQNLPWSKFPALYRPTFHPSTTEHVVNSGHQTLAMNNLKSLIVGENSMENLSGCVIVRIELTM